jgi:hypothetical protein
MEGKVPRVARALRPRGGSTPEHERSLPRLASSTMLAARRVLCSRSRVRWKRETGAPPHQSLSLPMSASKRNCILALGAPSFPFPLRNAPSGLRAGFCSPCPLLLDPDLLGLRFAPFLLLPVDMAPAPDALYCPAARWRFACAFAEAPRVALRHCSSYSWNFFWVLADPPRSVTPGQNSFRKMSFAKDFYLDVAPGFEFMLRNIIMSPCMSLVASRLLHTSLNNLCAVP